MVAAVAKGEADVAIEVTGSKERFKEIASYNTDTNAETGTQSQAHSFGTWVMAIRYQLR